MHLFSNILHRRLSRVDTVLSGIVIMILQFDLVCERAYLRPYYQLTVSLGQLLGGPIAGLLGDR